MAKVITSTPSSSTKKTGKRKTTSQTKTSRSLYVDPDDLSVAHALASEMLDERLASRDKWQVCTQRNLSLVRAECMTVRREIGHVQMNIDTVQMQVEDGLAAYERQKDDVQRCLHDQRSQMQTCLEKIEASEKTAIDHKEVTQRQLVKMNKRLETHVEKQQQVLELLVDEEILLTQLAGLQERHEAELANLKSEIETAFEQKLKAATEEMTRRFGEMQEGLRRKERDENEHEQHAQLHSRQLRDDMQSLVRRINDLEHDCKNLRGENADLKEALHTSRQEFNSFDDQIVHLTRELERQGHALRTMPPPMPPHYSPPLHTLPPPPLPPPVDLEPLERRLHFVAKDMRLMADDYSRWKDHADSNHHLLRQEMLARMRDLQDAVFKALNHDSDQHKFENHRLKDACFDVRADLMDVRKELTRTRNRLEQDIRSISQRQIRVDNQTFSSSSFRVTRRSPPSPAGIRPRHNQGPRQMFGNRGVSDIEQSYFGGPFYERRSRSRSPPATPRSLQESPPRRRSRSRSRSRGRSRDRGREDSQPPLVSTEMLYRPLNRTDDVPRPPSRVGPPGSPPMGSTEAVGHPTGRPHRPSRTHEVIVIEDGDDDSEVPNGGDATSQSVQAPPPHMAPPDPVLDELDDSSSQRDAADELMDESPPAAPAGERLVARDATIADLQTGALLYTCFGGAPTLAFEWTKYFSPLRQSDIVDATEMLKFQVRFPAIAAHPPFLSQFVVKAYHVQQETMPSQGSNGTPALSKIDGTAVEREFSSVVTTLRNIWVQRALDLVSNASSSTVTLTPPPTLAVGATVQVEKAFHKEHWIWSQTHAAALAPLIRYGTQHMKGRGDAITWDAIDRYKPSPGVFLLLLCFDIVEVAVDRPFDAQFRLNAMGREIFTKLWESSLNRLPVPLFIECSWLDDQSATIKRIPVLGLAHMLTTVLFWYALPAQTLPTDKYEKCIEQSMRLLTEAIRLNGQPLTEGAMAPLLTLGDESHMLDLVFTSPDWAQFLELECPREVIKELHKAE